MKIQGIAAVVTGAASGLGEATARELARRGAKVALFDRDADKGEKVASEIGGIFCEVDVTSDEKVAAAFASAREAHGQERVLVNCAGVANAAKTVGRDKETRRDQILSDAQFELAIQINLIGTLPLHRAFGARHGRSRAARGWRERRDRQHRLGRRRGRADRPGGLFGVEGRRAGDGVADRARPDERGRARQHHPAGRVQDADGGDDAAECAGSAGPAGAVPQAARQGRGICAARGASWSKLPT